MTSPAFQAFLSGVIVIFKPQWDTNRILLWTQSNALAYTPKVLIESLNMWMIVTPAEALHTANKIRESQAIVSATLWQAVAIR